MVAAAIDAVRPGATGKELVVRLITDPSLECIVRGDAGRLQLRLSPARDPPYFKSRALRRKLGELDAPREQVEMFGA